jgi:hypothetical protein
MPPLCTARQHFDEDIDRARNLVTHANSITEDTLRGDILRSAWMMAVGACDAYFSDAYGDLISRALRAKDLQQQIEIPERLGNLRIPAIAVIRQATDGWRWRMAARELIEDENVLSTDKIRSLFKQFCSEGNKPLNQESIESWILHRDSRRRLFGITSSEYRRLNNRDKADARKKAVDQCLQRFAAIFQRRHDCIHNCDRPKAAIQEISDGMVRKAIQDIDFLVRRCHDLLAQQFPEYLLRIGFSRQTRNQVCM